MHMVGTYKNQRNQFNQRKLQLSKIKEYVRLIHKLIIIYLKKRFEWQKKHEILNAGHVQSYHNDTKINHLRVVLRLRPSKSIDDLVKVPSAIGLGEISRELLRKLGFSAKHFPRAYNVFHKLHNMADLSRYDAVLNRQPNMATSKQQPATSSRE